MKALILAIGLGTLISEESGDRLSYMNSWGYILVVAIPNPLNNLT